MPTVQLKVKNLKDEEIAILECAGSDVKIKSCRDKEFESFLKETLARGIELVVDRYDSRNDKLVMVEEKIPKEKVEYYTLRDFLKRKGYEVSERHLETENEIKRLLSDIPDNNADKTFIISRLPEMSHLEQTTILKELKKAEV